MTTLAPSKPRSRRKPKVKVDLGCGQTKREGFTGLDIADVEGVDIVHDLETFPWPFEDNSVDELHSSHYVEHTRMHLPDGRDGLVAFMDEAHRILKPGGTFQIFHPYAMSRRAFQDPFHRRFIPEDTWYYFDAGWRKANALDHYPISADFEVVLIQGLGIPDEFHNRSAEAQQFARVHYWNVVGDIGVELRKR